MCSPQGEVGVKGTANLAFFFNGGVIVGVDSRGRHATSQHIISDRLEKIKLIDGILTTMCGNNNAIYKVWDDIKRQVEKNKQKGNPTTVGMASDCALKFVKAQEDFKPCKLFIVGKNKEEKVEIWLLKSNSEKKELEEIKTFSMIGKGTQKLKEATIKNFNVQMSQDEGLELARRILLKLALEKPGIGGHIIIYRVNSIGTALLTYQPVPKVLPCYYDRLKNVDKTTVFVLSLDHIDDMSVNKWFRSGSMIPAVKPWYVHTIGQVRGGYNLRRVVMDESELAADVFGAVTAVCQAWGLPNRSTDPIVSKMPFVSFCGERFYFAEASKSMLAKLCDENIDI